MQIKTKIVSIHTADSDTNGPNKLDRLSLQPFPASGNETLQLIEPKLRLKRSAGVSDQRQVSTVDGQGGSSIDLDERDVLRRRRQR